MFRTLETTHSGSIFGTSDLASVDLPATGCIRWIDLTAQDEAQLAILAERFRFHPLTIEDCAHFDQRPKLESYGEYLFVVLHGFRPLADDNQVPDPYELHIFLGKDYLVTVHAEPIPALETVWRRIESDSKLLHRGSSFICYLLADAIIDAYFPVLDQISIHVDDIEERVLDRHHLVDLSEIFLYKRLLVALRRILSPQRDVLLMLAKQGDGWVDERTSLYFQDVYDHVLILTESVESTRDLLGNALEAYLWNESQRTNEIMKRLTLLSAIFLPLTFVTGFFGQNFADIPFENRALLALMLISCAVIPASMVYYFKRSRWF
ncbi:MAG: magnesium/cobalt transporter CorA [Pirellulaceae bacterium]|nr:magnesium/cobalt transporter CorA [Pirellulaceae bacterium]